jgi:hypothetical protein
MLKYVNRVNVEINILHTIKRRQANWIGDILRRNCTVNPAIEGKLEERTEVEGRRGGGMKQLLDHLKQKRGYLKFKKEALYRTL